MHRRDFLFTSFGVAALPAFPAVATLVPGSFEITRSDAEWRSMLSNAQYNVMREAGTERSGSSPLDRNYADGTYYCRGCDLALYSSEHKFDSGTGWPSFWDVRANAIGTMDDSSWFSTRTECHCRRCGSHLGHIFNDGPQPTGLRHCLNGVSLVFRSA